MQIVRKHDRVVLAILARQHDVLAPDLPREQRHSLTLRLFAVQRTDLEGDEVAGLDELWQDSFPVVCGIGRVVDHAAVIVDKAHETGILDALALGLRHREDHPFGNLVFRPK